MKTHKLMNQIKTNQTNHWKVICQNALH